MATTELAILDDDALLQRAQGSQQNALEALETLLERYASTVCSIAFAVLHHREDALDATQIALCNIAREVRGAQWRAKNIRNCVYTSAHAAAVDLLRQRSARRRRETAAAAQAAPREAPMASGQIERHEAVNALREELAALDGESASALAMYHLDGLSISEIARTAGISIAACKQRLSRGREKLREKLERRGIALAGAVIMPEMLNELYATARVFSAQVGTARFAQLANSIANGVLNEPVPGGPPPSQVQDGSAANGAQSMSRGAKMQMALIGACLVLVAGIISWVARSPAEAGAGAVQGYSSVKSHRDNGTRTPEGQASAATDASSRELKWRTPVRVGRGSPLSFSTTGKNASLLVSAPEKPELRRVYTSDKGATWNSHAIAGSSLGTVEIVQHSDGFAIYEFPLSESLQPKFEIHWKQYDAGNAIIGAPGSRNVGAGLDLWASRHLGADGGEWTFLPWADRSKLDFGPPADTGIAAGYAAEPGFPADLAKIKASTGNPVVVWAKNRTTAGLVAMQNSGQASGGPDYAGWKLYHFRTDDGGKSWIQNEIPLLIETESESRRLFAGPVSVCRNGNRVCVVLIRRVPNGNCPNSADDSLYACYSGDLGATWGKMSPVSTGGPAEMFNSHASSPKVHFVGEHIFAVYTRWPSITEPTEVVLKSSVDNGVTWTDVAAIPKDMRGCLSASDETALHVATFDKDGEISIHTFGANASTPAPGPEAAADASAF